MTDIFISYASSDRERIRPLVDGLEKQGWSVWWDRQIPPGKTWDQVIKKALDSAKCIVVVWSKNSVQSEWVKDEADVGKRRAILIPVLIDNVEIPLGFGRIQAAWLVDWQGRLPHQGFEQLSGAVAEILGHSPVQKQQVEGKRQEEYKRSEQEGREPEEREKAARDSKQSSIIEEEGTGQSIVDAKVLTRETAKSAGVKIKGYANWVYWAVGGLLASALVLVGLWYSKEGMYVLPTSVQTNTQTNQATSSSIDTENVFSKGMEFYESEDYQSALPLFKQAAGAGNAEAMNMLGGVYAFGLGVEKNGDEAVRWYTKAVEAGSAKAMYNLGILYLGLEGLDVKIDHNEAVRMIGKVAEAGDAEAMSTLGQMHSEGLGVKKDYHEAIRWYRRAAEAGSALAMNNLGGMYFHGLGVEKDYDEAFSWFRKSAEAGHVDAMGSLGQMYLDGLGVKKDYDEGVRWLRKGAEAQSAVAMYNLGLAFIKGLGVKKDYKEALHWLHKAAYLDYPAAKDLLKELGVSETR